jgi:hypothetical protein
MKKLFIELGDANGRSYVTLPADYTANFCSFLNGRRISFDGPYPYKADGHPILDKFGRWTIAEIPTVNRIIVDSDASVIDEWLDALN